MEGRFHTRATEVLKRQIRLSGLGNFRDGRGKRLHSILAAATLHQKIMPDMLAALSNFALKLNLAGDPRGKFVGEMPVDHIDILAVGHAAVLQINRRIYRVLARVGWQVEIAIPRSLPWARDPNFVQPDHPDDPPIHRLEPRGRRLRYWSFEGLTELLDRKRPRIVYLENGPDSLMAWMIGGWCKRNGAFLIASTNENDILPIKELLQSWRPKASLRSLRSHIWGRLARGRVCHVVAICADGRESMRCIGFENAVTVTPLGFDPALFYPDASRRDAIRQALGLVSPVVAYFGRVTQSKGVHILIAALGHLKDQPWHLLMDDFEHDSTADANWFDPAIDQAGIRDRLITFKATHDGIADYMRAADIVVVPSVWKEQYGRVASEAMACGCAVVVSDIGALPELVGDAGVTVAPDDVKALSGAIGDLIANPQRRAALALRAQARARHRLSLDQQAVLLDSLFRQISGTSPYRRA
jgi:glycosyltransferase involved in cell wall biosynthesis